MTDPAAQDRAAGGPGVAHFRDELFKATETFIYEYVKGLRTVRPLLVTFRRVGQEAFPYDGPSVELAPPSGWRRALRTVRRLALRRPDPPTFDDPRTYRALERHDARVLHAHFGRDAWWALPVARRTGLPLVTSFYGFDAWLLPRDPVWREHYAELFRDGRLFLAEGPAMAERLRDLGAPADRVAVQPIAIDVQRYPFQARTRPAGPARLLFCGRFVEKKGLAFALEAVARVRRRHDVVFDVIGDGPLRPEIEARVQRLGLQDCVRLRGMVRHDAMIRALGESHILLQPSVVAADGDTEGGAPTTLLEAQATGLPIVATRHQDIPNVTVDGQSAVLVPERDAEALADAIEGLLREPDRWEAMGKAGRKFVAEHHDRAPLIQRLESRYRELAS